MTATDLEKCIAEMQERNERLRREVAHFRAVIEAAPHGEDCRMLDLGYDNCWKADA